MLRWQPRSPLQASPALRVSSSRQQRCSNSSCSSCRCAALRSMAPVKVRHPGFEALSLNIMRLKYAPALRPLGPEQKANICISSLHALSWHVLRLHHIKVTQVEQTLTLQTLWL